MRIIVHEFTTRGEVLAFIHRHGGSMTLRERAYLAGFIDGVLAKTSLMTPPKAPRERCPRCQSPMHHDPDAYDEGAYCLTCGHRPRTPDATIEEDDEAATITAGYRARRGRRPSIAGMRL